MATSTKLETKEQDGKIGFVDSSGAWIIKPVFDDIQIQMETEGDDFEINYFINGIAIVKSGELWGVINENGNWIIQPTYDAVGAFYDGYAKVVLNGKIGFIDSAGNTVIEPTDKLSWAYPHYDVIEVLSGFQTAYGVMDKEGKWEIKPILKQGILPIKTIWGKLKNKWGYLSLQDGWIVKPQFSRFYHFFDGLARVETTDGKWGWIDETGKWIIKPLFDKTEEFTSDGIAQVEIDGKRGKINIKGEWVFGPLEISDR